MYKRTTYKRSTKEFREIFLQDCFESELPYEEEMFDEWLRRMKAEALREAADRLVDIDQASDAVFWDGKGYEQVTHWLRERADSMEATK